MTKAIRFSNRLPLNLDSNEVSRRVSAVRAAGGLLLDLTVSNPTVVLPDYPHTAIAEAYGNLTNLTYHPDPAGSIAARRAVQAYYATRGIHVDLDRILLTASTSEAYAYLFKLFCDPGQEILVPRPSYPLFDHLAALESVQTAVYPLRYDGSWFISVRELASKITDRTRAIVLVNPNNPTGSYWKRDEAAELLALAERANLPIISDEVFTDYPLRIPDSCVRSFAEFETGLSFSLDGLSKAAGMPQVKLGWLIINGCDDRRREVRERLELISDTYLAISMPVQAALPALLRIGEGIRALLTTRTWRNLTEAEKVLRGTAAHCLLAEGGWTVIVRLPQIQSEEEWTLLLLRECSVLVQPGYFFDIGDGVHIVLSLITPEADFDEALRRIRNLLLTLG